MRGEERLRGDELEIDMEGEGGGGWDLKEDGEFGGESRGDESSFYFAKTQSMVSSKGSVRPSQKGGKEESR